MSTYYKLKSLHLLTFFDGVYKKIFGWETDAHSNEYVTFLRTFITSLLDHLKANGDDKRCFFHVSDEPQTGDEENYLKSKNSVADLLKDYPIMDALSSFEFYKKGIVDHPIPSNDMIAPFINANVPDLWTYYCVSQAQKVSNRFQSMPNFRNRSSCCHHRKRA